MINWKVRVKNFSFWVSIVIAVFTPLLAYAGITAKDLTSWGILGGLMIDAVKNPYVLLLIAVSVYNAVVDPTSTGITDSSIARTYDSPNSEK